MWVRHYERQTMAVVMEGLESAFRYVGGVPSELLFDQMKAVIVEDNREVGGRRMENTEFLRYAYSALNVADWLGRAPPPMAPGVSAPASPRLSVALRYATSASRTICSSARSRRTRDIVRVGRRSNNHGRHLRKCAGIHGDPSWRAPLAIWRSSTPGTGLIA